MTNRLVQFGNVPITSAMAASAFPELKAKASKVSELEKSGEIIRLKKGLYAVSPEISGQPLSTELIANHLYAPSYISRHSALRFYGLIPESVYTIQSMTVKHSRSFETSVGRYEYFSLSREVFPIGLCTKNIEGASFIIATPEKALCDLIANAPAVNLRYIKEAEEYLADDLRLDMDALFEMNTDILRAYAQVGKKAQSINTVIKLIER